MNGEKKINWPHLVRFGASIGITVADGEKKLAIQVLHPAIFQKALGRNSAAEGFIEMGIAVPISTASGSLLVSSGTRFTIGSLIKVFPDFDKTVDMALFSQSEILIREIPKQEQTETDPEQEPAATDPGLNEANDGEMTQDHQKARALYDQFQELDPLEKNAVASFKRKLRQVAKTISMEDDKAVFLIDHMATKLQMNVPGEKTIEFHDPSQEPTSKPQAGSGKKRKTSKKDRIDDSGEKFGGARKDIAGRGLMVSDLQDMTDIERDELVAKSNIWPPMKYKEMQENGIEPAVAIYLKLLRDKLPTHYKKNKTHINQQYEISRQSYSYSHGYSAEQYIESLTAIYKAVGSVKTMAELNEALEAFRDKYIRFENEIEKSVNEEGEYSPRWEEFCFREQLTQSIGSKARQVLVSSYVIKAVNEAAEKEGWGYLIKTKVTKEKDKDTNLIPQRPHLEHIQDGSDHRAGKDITPDEFYQKFGFRGVEFGNWLPQDERQSVLNFATNALGDLSVLLKLDYQDIGLDFLDSMGMGAAFGSRGKGKAAAHYEPGRKVFNLTRMNGAGSLAHEYGHALDFFMQHTYGANTLQFAEKTEDIRNKIKAVKLNFDRLNRVMTHTKLTALVAAERATEIGLKHCTWGGNWARAAATDLASGFLRNGADSLRMEQYKQKAEQYRQAVENIINQFKEDNLPVTSTENDARAFERTDCACRFIERALADFASDLGLSKTRMSKKERDNMANCLRSGIGSLHRAQQYAAMPPKQEVDQTSKSNYLLNAEKLDVNRSKYWSDAKELFARAFESWCFDKLADQYMRSDYLVHGVEADRHADAVRYRGNPYPSGDERQNINLQMDKLVDSVSVLIRELSMEQKEQLEEEATNLDNSKIHEEPAPSFC